MAMLWNPYTGDNPPDTWDESCPETLEDYLANQEETDAETADCELTPRTPELPHGSATTQHRPQAGEQHAAP